ncbi:uncharacterized protein C8Q71DRAFT_700444 [Rhodofomes roseus]|uniref:DUF4203 domain-containing protein n=1 Tax=Rhodofomes roseus TaxID=34475 RepID=A0ABQ8KRC3_9APHY|nr:uncharacterized protein C8Q71DRAFT_700444 [Rhodofomes roseus]KAH9841345.1 hypothetical protein C8Q71DRAFT_700444 [Rhodofomes roseus]
MASNCSTCSLEDLLDSTSYTLAYALPLLLISFVLTFAGTFLALDRTRVFAPRRNAVKPLPHSASELKRIESSIRWLSMFEGGAGGVAAGYVFAVHLVTFMSSLIPSVTTSATLSPKAFLATWLLSALCCMFLGGRWKYLALAFAGIAGYSTFGVACAVMIHPSLMARIVLVSIFTPIGLILCLLPLAKYQHAFLRFATSSVGAFGVVLSVAILANIPVWREVWARLWIDNANGWGSSVEKGLSTVYCVLLLCGSACDWFLHRKLGENPDEKWDGFLADYVAALPNEADRAGTYKPLSSFWSRLFGHHNVNDAPAEVIFPTDADLKRSIPSPYKLQKQRSLIPVTEPTEPQFHREPTFLRKHRKKGVRGFRRTREAVKFSPLNVDDLSSSSDDDDDSDLDDLKPPVKSWAVEHRPSLSRNSSVTLANDGDQGVKNEGLHPPKANAEPDYSDFEEDVAAGALRRSTGPEGEPWTPAFIRRHSLKGESGTPSISSKPSSSQRTAVERTSSPITAPGSPFTPVPATPSLIRAIERVQAAYIPPESSPPLPASANGHEEHPKGPKWNTFWQEVKSKAGHELAHHSHPPGGQR